MFETQSMIMKMRIVVGFFKFFRIIKSQLMSQYHASYKLRVHSILKYYLRFGNLTEEFDHLIRSVITDYSRVRAAYRG